MPLRIGCGGAAPPPQPATATSAAALAPAISSRRVSPSTGLTLPGSAAAEEAHERLGDADRLLAAVDLERERGRHLDAAGDVVDGGDRRAHADSAADRERGREAHLVEAVV